MTNFSDLMPVGLDHGRILPLDEAVRIEAGPGTDAFTSPDGAPGKDRLVGLRLVPPLGNWAVSALVEPAFAAAFDAGAFMLRTGSGAWAKLAFERAPDGRTMAVSVVTRGLSDDANGPLVESPALFLRAACTGPALAFHVSHDGCRWDLTRFFALPDRVVALDLVAQSPTGTGCAVTFRALRVLDHAPSDLRDGS